MKLSWASHWYAHPATIGCPAEWRDGMVVEAALRTGLGVAARPDAQVDGVDRLAVGGGVLRQQSRAGPRRRGALGQGVIEAAPAAAVRGLQAEVGQRGDRLGRQQGIDQLEQGVGTALEAAVEVSAEGAEGREVISGHARPACQNDRQMANAAAPPLRLGLNHKLSL